MKNLWKPLLLGSVLAPITLSFTDPLTGLIICLVGGVLASLLYAMDARHVDKPHQRRSQFPIMILCSVLLFPIVWIDVVTGYDVDVSILYFIPIAIAAWRLPLFGSSLVVAFATAAWVIAQFCSQHGIASTTILWNGIIRLVTFTIIEWAIRREREHREQIA